MEMTEYRDDSGRKCRVYDTSRKRWYFGKVLHVERIDEQNEPDGWSVELRNGNRGMFDAEHLEFMD
jgi:hypothetical protein